jgi:hypothetical protein
MAYPQEKLQSNGYEVSPSFRPYLIGNVSDNCSSIWTLLQVSMKHIFIDLTSFTEIPKSVGILHKTSLLIESWAFLNYDSVTINFFMHAIC